MQFLLPALIIWNLFAFTLVGTDKRKARLKKWRVPERYFFITALLWGAVGVLSGMYFFHHKTKHKQFQLGIPFLLLLNILSLWWLFHPGK